MSQSDLEDTPPAKKLKLSDSETSGLWERVHDDEDWALFHKSWWAIDATNLEQPHANATKLKQLNAVLTIPSTRVHAWFDMKSSRGRMLVREETVHLYDRLCDLEKNGVVGVSIVGQPRIGKSYSIIYALLRRMVEGRQVLFSNTCGETYRFDAGGVWQTRDLTDCDIPRADAEGRAVWSLIDAVPAPVSAEPKAVACDAAFAVLATSPEVEGYGRWLAGLGSVGKRIIANPWTDKELQILISSDELSSFSAATRLHYKTLENVEELVSDVGPCPGDIISYLAHRSLFEEGVRDAVNEIGTPQELDRLLDDSDENIGKASPRLTLIHRHVDLDGHERMLVSIKTAKIAAMLVQKRADFHHQSALILFHAVVTNTALGKLWSRGLHAMSRLPGTTAHPHRFQHSLTSSTRVLDVDDDQATFCSDEVPMSAATAAAASPSWMGEDEERIVPAVVKYYLDIDGCPLAPEHHHRPMKPGNPLFDSFYLHVGEDNVVVWVFQMPTPDLARDEKASGFTLLKHLVRRLEDKFASKTVELKYVLVVPYQPEVAVRWSLSEGWDEVRGEVYALYLDSSVPFDAIF